jgi:hypothetical protein
MPEIEALALKQIKEGLDQPAESAPTGSGAHDPLLILDPSPTAQMFTGESNLLRTAQRLRADRRA